jgi:hypothetical protein
MKSITSPNATKQVEDDIYRPDDACYARELDQLLHRKFPDMANNDIVTIVTELTSQDSYKQHIRT